MAVLKYKNKNGEFVALNNYIVLPIIPVQTTGSSTTEIMSQNAVTSALDTKVDKISGKGLSTNDYTTVEKNKLAGIANNANNYTLPKATTTTLGGIIVGGRLSVDANGKLTATYTYTLPAATSSVLGGVKVGSNITNSSGTISLTKANVTAALGVDPTTKYVTLDTLLVINGVKSFNRVINSSVATGTAPILVSSTTLCTNLNADMLDGKHSIGFSDNTASINKQLTDSSDKNIKLLTIENIGTTYNTGYIDVVITVRSNNGYVYSSNGLTTAADIQIVYEVSGNITEYKVMCNPLFLRKYALHAYKRDNNLELWYEGGSWEYIEIFRKTYRAVESSLIFDMTAAANLPTGITELPIYDSEPDDWYGVSWSETSSNPDCSRIGNMDMHRTLPILSAMKPYAFNQGLSEFKDSYVPLKEDFQYGEYTYDSNSSSDQLTLDVNIMIKIPEFWYTDDYVSSNKTHNLKICPYAKAGWNHHKEAFVSAYELYNLNNRAISNKGYVPTVNFNRTDGRTWARANGYDGEAKWNIYTYEEHRAICHLFLVEYATRNSQKAVNTSLTADGFRQGGLGSGCTTGLVTINGVNTYAFVPTGSSNILGSGSGEVTVTIQLTDASGTNTTTVTRICNRYRGIENPFGHVWKHVDDVISQCSGTLRTWYKSNKPSQFSTYKNTSYKPLRSNEVTTGYKTEITATPTCDFFAAACGGSESTYWCDYNWDNTGTSERCLLIGASSYNGGWAGLFALASADGVAHSYAGIGSRLTYLPWAE